MSRPKVMCRFKGCALPAERGCCTWAADPDVAKPMRWVWATFCDVHTGLAILKGAKWMYRRPRAVAPPLGPVDGEEEL